MYTKEELEKLCKNELLEKAKSINARRYRGKNALSKEDLIVSILEKQNIQTKSKQIYIDTIVPGVLVAFQADKVRSAKVLKKSTKNRKLKLITEYGREFIVGFDDILWVKTGTRWPKGIYQLLKGKN